MKKVNYILASGSPRRINMMREKGYEPQICPADIDENIPLNHDMNETVMFLALKKAQWVREKLNAEKEAEKNIGETPQGDKKAITDDGSHEADSIEERITKVKTSEEIIRPDGDEAEKEIIIAADTIVYGDGEIMGKPKNPEDGFRMLSKLRNTYHYVVTGVALIERETGFGKVFTEVTKVWFTDYSDEELWEYLALDEAYDKAGGYAIQGYFSRYTDHIEGDFNTVVGFPWARTEAELKAFLED